MKAGVTFRHHGSRHSTDPAQDMKSFSTPAGRHPLTEESQHRQTTHQTRSKRKNDSEDKDAVMARVSGTTVLEELKDVDLIIEAAVRRLSPKRHS